MRARLLMQASRAALLALAWTHLLGCAAEPGEPTGQAEHAVIGGVESPPERDNVVYIKGGGICTASLVAPGLMITARHCVSDFDNSGRFTCASDGTVDEGQPRSPSDAGSVGQPLPAEVLEFYVGQLITLDDLNDGPDAVGVRVFAPETDTICRNDVALVQIEPELDLEPLPLRLEEGTYQGDPMLVVGYGQDETSAIDRFERDVSVLSVGQSDFYPISGEATVRTFTVGQSVCPGDSGGPAITDRGAIAGVFSRINFDCMSTLASNTYTQLAPFASFIESAFEEAGYEPILERPEGAAGAAGAPSDTSGGGSGGSGGNGTGGTSGGSGGSAGGGSGGESEPKSGGDACVCRAGVTPRNNSLLLAVLMLSGVLVARRPGKKRRRRP